MTPSHPGPPRSFGLFLHLKSGARGFRFDVRSSHMAPPQMGQAGIPLAGGWGAPDADGGDAATGEAGTALRSGQITPSHSLSLHLKSGAFGLRLPTRLSHIAPSHVGQDGGGESIASADCCCSVIDAGVNGGGRFSAAI